MPHGPTRDWNTDSCLIWCICPPPPPSHHTSPLHPKSSPFNFCLGKPTDLELNQCLSFASQQWLLASNTNEENTLSPTGTQHHCSLPMSSPIAASPSKTAIWYPGAQPGLRSREGPNIHIYCYCLFPHTSLDDLT